MNRVPLKLKPIAWGSRDRELAWAVFQNARQTTPPTQIPWTGQEARLGYLLRHHHFSVLSSRS